MLKLSHIIPLSYGKTFIIQHINNTSHGKNSSLLRYHQCRPYSKEVAKFKILLGGILNNSKKLLAYNRHQRPKMYSKLSTSGIRLLKLGLIGVVAVITILLGAPCRDEDGDVILDEFCEETAIKEYILRTLREINYYRKLLKNPTKENLLPDPLNHPYVQPKYTLVLELRDILVHPDWSYGSGWRFKKRPLLDSFFAAVSEQYEIVIYTSEQGHTAFPLIDAIDSNKVIAYKLVRDATTWSHGCHIKNLNNLNRPLSKIICIDWDYRSYKNNPENLFCIKKWEGNDDDTTLLDLVIFLKSIADNNVEDVREVLKAYCNTDDPINAFRVKQKQLIDNLEAREAARREQKKQNKPRWRTRFFRKKEEDSE